MPRQKLSECGKAFFKLESPELLEWQSETKTALLERGYEGIHAFLESKKVGETDEDRLKALETADGYLTWHRNRLGYRERPGRTGGRFEHPNHQECQQQRQ